MTKYIIKRIALGLLTVFIVATLTFFLMRLVPGGPFLSEKTPSAATLKALEEKYHFNEPLSVQYRIYMENLVKGDFGVSMKRKGTTVNDIIAKGFPVSARIGGLSILISFCIGVPIGTYAAYKRGKFIDKIIMFFATCGIAVPSFVVSTILLIVFSGWLGWFPSFGLTTPLHYVMPVTALCVYPTAYISRLMRSSMLDVLGQDYMRTAKAKGVGQFSSLFKHALRNSILPVVTYLGPLLAYTVVGSFVIEKIFNIPGLGRDFISSITSRDYPVIMGTTVFLALLLVAINVVVDIVYKIIDPRIKLK
ncbi:MAG: ABC transporter permease [Clostridia bacterium]|nr:ABC transporter permease [Clostridia bacterium]